jgi:opacity protein-like surface antigen
MVNDKDHQIGAKRSLTTESLFMKKLSTMKHHQIRIVSSAACAALFIGMAVASAQVYVPPASLPPPSVPPPRPPPDYVADFDKEVGFYFNGNLGPSFIPNFKSSRLGFEGDFHMDPGVRFAAEPGYNFLSTRLLTLGGEFETGVIYNRISHVDNQELQIWRRGDYYQVPLLGNLEIKFHPNSFVVPYVGLGGGGDATWTSMNRWDYYGGYGKSSHDEVDPAVQAMAGVRFRLNSMIDFGVGYKFLADFPSEGKYIATHAAQATFTVRF